MLSVARKGQPPNTSRKMDGLVKPSRNVIGGRIPVVGDVRILTPDSEKAFVSSGIVASALLAVTWKWTTGNDFDVSILKGT
jgi:hypothetical protein